MIEKMDKIILTTREELKEIILEVLQEHFRPVEKPETLSLEQALDVLRENGFPTSKAKMYKLTSKNKIPYKKYGSRLTFSRKELLQWADNQLLDLSNNIDGILATVRSAHRQSDIKK